MKSNLLLTLGIACLALLGTSEAAQAQYRGGPVLGGYGNYGGNGTYGGYGMGAYSGYGNLGWGNYGYNNSFYYTQPGMMGTVPQGYGYMMPRGFNYNSIGSGVPTYPGIGQGTPIQSFYPGPGLQTDDRARIRVEVPNAGATVWVDDHQTKQQGTQRIFTSPPLEKGWDYTYKVRASWDENGRSVSREKTVRLQPGQETVVNFAEGQGTRDSVQTPATQPETTPAPPERPRTKEKQPEDQP
jgi:uncharacterized protein (TIGR03000 family)